MQVSAGADGIQKLLAAEQEAQRIVLEARRVKQERLREAKTEAEKEIAAYRAEREGLYQKKVSEGSSGSQATLQRLTQETGVEVAKVQDDVKAKKQQVVDMLYDHVVNVQFT
uniref:V-type proton ATPase subunit G n=1 Tax=Dunaliella tertiolecta TaxID=3047 RepID=A0A7S3VT47_DUNTE|mmetsp:Transcript_24563/g.66987  ORF Transcript_24563/g.66987 Transcript_24563/m.66987 type:complete len:112 (+) Transcript_24563:103-438(+)|eukprot:CAMPEP_0202346428 /NCGR_PEP_ID=MMETSP1126-20121109/5223_1 /ASSEMBLY_ACC=CAM_ASM_000457 /TAXON_ID=3047 /ORGANISM="Dunaliella tertiolecta, Strain CCMP1320" /LENGTH=111 /DNA_ID=CAMNT_0048937835 /DNA_START=64 /DNA_END=399 /DNA_ORIENTATION=-